MSGERQQERNSNTGVVSLEIQRMWYTKCAVILEIIGATGIVTEGLQKNVEAIPGEHHNM